MWSFWNYKLDTASEKSFLQVSIKQIKNPPIILVAIIGAIGFIFLDLLYHKDLTLLQISLITRLVTLFFLLATRLVISRKDNIAQIERLLFAAVIIFVTHMHITSIIRALDHNINVWDNIIIISIFLFVPMSVGYQAVSGVYLTVGSFIVWTHLHDSHVFISEGIATFASYIFSIVLGCFFSLRMRILNRKNFAQIRVETKMRNNLERALKEIKTLKGILPICASCKKVRDDDGYWNQIELYIEKHSDAHFSHGICEECADKLYGEEEWYQKVSKES